MKKIIRKQYRSGNYFVLVTEKIHERVLKNIEGGFGHA